MLGFVKNPRLMRGPERLARRHLRSQVSDPELLERVKPDYAMGCKRILTSNRWYPALAKPNVELLTGGLREVRPRSIVTGDGVERGADTVEVRAAAQDGFNADVDERMWGTVWETGCSSWYQDGTGRNAALWPDWTWRFRRRAARVRDADYELSNAVSSASAAPA